MHNGINREKRKGLQIVRMHEVKPVCPCYASKEGLRKQCRCGGSSRQVVVVVIPSNNQCVHMVPS